MEIKIYSRKALEQLIKSGEFPENTAVISFCDPGDEYVMLPRTCRRYFCELEDDDYDSLSAAGFDYDAYFSEAAGIAEFVYNAHDLGLDIICQCEYGMSRSSACAAAIMEHFYHNGITIFADYRYCPNQLVYNKISDALAAHRNRITDVIDQISKANS